MNFCDMENYKDMDGDFDTIKLKIPNFQGKKKCLHRDAPSTSSMIYRDIVSCIVVKVNFIHNMASSITNRRLHIAWGFSNDISNSVWFVFWLFRF